MALTIAFESLWAVRDVDGHHVDHICRARSNSRSCNLDFDQGKGAVLSRHSSGIHFHRLANDLDPSGLGLVSVSMVPISLEGPKAEAVFATKGYTWIQESHLKQVRFNPLFKRSMVLPKPSFLFFGLSR
jgi:hypothetical protein